MVAGSEVEILVHITAPSRGPDDARYRALAHAYLNFEPATRQKIDTGSPIGFINRNGNDNGAGAGAGTGGQLLEELQQPTQEERESEASYRPDEESGRSRESIPSGSQHAPAFPQPLSSPRLSFNSVLESPAFRPPNSWQQHDSQSDRDGSQELQGSINQWPQAPSTISDSQPENDRNVAVLVSPTTMFKLLLQQNDISADTSPDATTSPMSIHYGSQAIESSQHILGVSAKSMLPSSLPSSSVPVARISRLQMPEVQVSRTSSADEVAPTRKSVTEAHPSLPANRTVHFDQPNINKISETSMPNTPTPAQQAAQPNGVQPRSSSQSFGSVVPATSTPPSFSCSRENRTGEKSIFKGSKLEIPATSMHGSLSSPSPVSARKRFSGPTTSSFEKEIPETATAPVAGEITQSTSCGGRYESLLGHQNNHPSATQETDFQSKREWPDTIPESVQVSSSAPAISSSKSFPENPKRQRLGILPSKPAITPLRISMSDTTNMSMTLLPSTPTISPWADNLDIYPPPATTSSQNKTPEELFLTPDLIILADRMGMSRFCPEIQTRDLRETERGFWRVNCETWSAQVKLDAWKRLGDFVGDSRAGWAVACNRDEACESIRVFCSGIVVGHIYLLLYMCSGNKIKNTGATWHEGNSEILIKMPG